MRSIDNTAKSSNPLEVKCPTCFKGFPITEISEHADLCAEEACGFSASRLEYGNLLMEFPCDEIESAHSMASLTSSEVPEMQEKTLQGGPAPNFLAKWVYEYISGGLDAVKIQIEDATTYSVKDIDY